MIQANELILPRGADLTITISVTDDAGNTINMGATTKLVILAIHANGNIVDKWSKNPAAGWQPLDVSGAATGQLSFKLLTSTTKNAPTGRLFYEVHAVFPDASFTDDAVLDVVSVDNYLCTIVDSKTNNLMLP